MIRLAVILCAGLACAGLACSDLQAQSFRSDPRAKQAVDDAVEALGGQRFLTMQDRVEMGRAYSFYRDKISGLSIATIFTQYFNVPPDKSGRQLGVREREVFGKNEEFGYVLFREDGAWEVTYRGPSELEQDKIDSNRRTTLNDILYFLRMRLKEPGVTFDWKGSDVIENQPVDMVDVIDNDNHVITVNFNKDTHLPVKETWVWHDPKTHDRNDEVTRYSIYRDHDGVMWPQQITRELNGEKKYQIFSDSVWIDANLPNSLFEKPTGPATRTNWKPPKRK